MLAEPVGIELVAGFAMVMVSLALVLRLPVPGLAVVRGWLGSIGRKPAETRSAA